ncbi:MAG: aminopeptidase [Actinomycetota bacterium]|nr:aminopeptidase [Actinomycetota bacterium]
MADPRVQEYARLLVERSIDVQPKWQVMVISQPAARPLLEEVVRLIARRGAYPLVRYSHTMEQLPFVWTWAEEAPLELLGAVAPADEHVWNTVDAWMLLGAPENTREGADIATERRDAVQKAHAAFLQRRLRMEIPWVTCRFPAPSLAQEAGMSLRAFEDFLYGAVLLDWDAEGEKMKRIKERFDRADQVRIVGTETDLRFSLQGREGEVDDGHANMPGGEVFYSPVEESTEGTVSFLEYPAYQEPDLVEGVRMRYEAGKVVDASATSNEDVLLAKLDRDDGARILGEFGIGCNPGIQRYMKNTLFDEKMYGTIHLAIGAGLPTIGGKNVSAVHWDMVKDLRDGGRIECDGEVVQQDGEWTF